jgi:choline monooxygenase
VRWGDGVPMVPADGAAVLARGDYSSQRRFELERDRVMRVSWFPGCRSSAIPNAGDYEVWSEFGDLLVIVRQPDLSVAAFHNVCQHRGARIVAESGTCAKNFVCPWHGFVYGLDGKLIGVRDRDSFDPGMLDDRAAPKVAAEEWAGFVWINLAGDAAPRGLHESLDELVAEIAPYEVDRMDVTRSSPGRSRAIGSTRCRDSSRTTT